MGRGNWRPYQDSELYDLRYFNLYERYEVSFEDWDQDMWDLFREEIEQHLFESFWKVGARERVSVPYTDFAGDNRVIFTNELVCIMMDGDAEAGHVGVAMVRLESDDEYSGQTYVENFNERYLDLHAQTFWERMGGEQRVRTSAWTSEEASV
jgi:hypothetical protein